MNPKLLSRIAWYLLLLVGLVLCLKSVREPDLWWMYRTGEWMFENSQVTYADPFSYTHAGTEWINVKWLFELLIVAFKAIGGPEMVFVLQAIFTSIILILAAKTTRILSGKEQIPYVAMSFAALIGLLAMDFRMIGRPEMSSHLLSAVYLYLLILYRSKPDTRWIWALIPLQLLWTNMHEAFGVGMVLLVAFIGAAWFEYYLSSDKDLQKAKKISFAAAGALAVVAINPRGPVMWLHPFNIFGQLSDNKYTTELIGYTDPAYWSKEAYISLAFLAFAVLGLIWSMMGKKEKTETSNLFSRLGWGYLGILGLFYYLSLTANRNIPFFIIASLPLVALTFDKVLVLLTQKVKALEFVLPIVAILIGIGSYGAVVSGKYHKWTNSRDQYGLQILNGHNPIGAAQFIQDNKISGTCFADYLSSAYLLWKLQPEFKTYIDLRDLDIFPSKFFDAYNQMIAQDAKAFDAEDKKYNFNYVVLLRRMAEGYPNLFVHLHKSANYELVFADPVAVLYVKKNAQNQPIIDQYSIAAKEGNDVFQPLGQCKASPIALGLSRLFNPLFKLEAYEGVDQDIIAASLYFSLGEDALCLKRAGASAKHSKEKWRGNEMIGLIYARRVLNPTNIADKPNNRAASNAAFDQALIENPKAVESLNGKAILLMDEQKFSEAIGYLQTAIKIDPQHPMVNEHLSICYQKMNK